MKEEISTDDVVLREHTHHFEAPTARLVVDWEYRQRSRFRSQLDDGREVAVMLKEAGLLADGDRLKSEKGEIIEVSAAVESLSEAHTQDPMLFARACYHMGNRHVPLQIMDARLRFKPDHVLEEMLRRLGLEISALEAPFDPERGAYGAHSHAHADSHAHSHSHSHSHNHSSAVADDDAQDNQPASEGRGPRIHWMEGSQNPGSSGG